MIASTSLGWVFVLALAAAGAWFAIRGLRPGTRAAERVSHLAHVVMAAAMVVMLWPAG
ncbi:hypothetical protein VA596_22985 [Amycolatopsis sp., V23-08]|uniref:DUF5134 domain-containing protein n=1 Tax=Amycolatopsis heterodermiae TaxID=3110235 RepID=A0ABU5R855_9PSEU|nr:hypothetical protein [Amycolatopsis sp., V23-08]MEA5362422.1 hypothetical protein [Amycolatopsis sp., V23-08]